MLLLHSCATDADGKQVGIQVESELESIFTPYGLMDAQIGDSLESVKTKLGRPSSTTGEELVYSGRTDEMDHTLYLNFDEGQLYEITLDFFPADSIRLDQTFDELRSIMDDRFQKSRPAAGYATWKAASPSGRLIEISLIDESLEHGSPLLMLNLLENYDRSYRGE